MIKRTLIAFAIAFAVVALAENAALGAGYSAVSTFGLDDSYETSTGAYDPNSFPPYGIYGFDVGQSDDFAVKVDGKKTVRWPFQYEWLTICKIRLQMEIGMFIRVKDCDKAEIIMEQVDCADIDRDSDEWPCYYGCLDDPSKLEITSNFDAELRGKVQRSGDVLKKDKYKVSVEPDTVTAGSSTKVEICVEAWEVQIEKGDPGDKEDIGFVLLQARPQL